MSDLNPRFYIGDIHGRGDLVRDLIHFIRDFAMGHVFDPQVTFLGDIVDRGPQSREAVECVRRVLEAWSGSELLKSNHDEYFVEAVDARFKTEKSLFWITQSGGIETLKSYSADVHPDRLMPKLAEYAHHIELLRNAKSYAIHGSFFACHAGIDPEMPIDDQRIEDLTLIREPFLNHIDPEMIPVIHGHTVTEDYMPVVTENRISIDTGAYESGRLTACFVDPRKKTIRFFQTMNGRGVMEVQPIQEDRGHGTVLGRLPELFAA